MVAVRKKKYESGEGAQYMTRKRALKYLQLSLQEFRKLCILKGVYPREPRNRKRAQKGSTKIQTLYHKKDIQFLLHEPIIWKLRDTKVYARKVKRAYGLKDFEAMKYQLSKYPQMPLDHIVKERYPTFVDALRDLDDCLTLCFLFSTFPALRHVPNHQSGLCRRLTVEFLHAVIEAKALRKVFISIKGYYYQIELKGQTITWVTPHHFSFQPQDKTEVDFRIMSTFVQFYTVLLGFVNFHIYNSLNLTYPPKLQNYGIVGKEKEVDNEICFVSERVAALNIPIVKSGVNLEEQETEIDQFPTGDGGYDLEEKKKEMMKIEKQKNLFKNMKFFLNREVPREPLVFIIRSLGGSVSWDKNLFVGATFGEEDETINYQIVDRPQIEKQYLSRYYVQPQWVFDSVNQCELLPVEKYLVGAVLPPHLSPFVNKDRDQVYVPPEEMALKDPDYKGLNKAESSDDDDDDMIAPRKTLQTADKESSEDDDEAGEVVNKNPKLKGMEVKRGEITKENPRQKAYQERQDQRLRVKMVPKKYKKLYKSMMDGRRKRGKEISLLKSKRRFHDKVEKKLKKEKKKKALYDAESSNT